MKYIILSLFFFNASAFSSEVCSSYLGVKVNGFIGETLETLAKTSDCNDNLKNLKFNTVEGQLKTDYCACANLDSKSIAGKSSSVIRANLRYQEIKKKAKKNQITQT